LFKIALNITHLKDFNTIKTLRQVIGSRTARQFSLGFVPTMGALHEGHISLINRAKDENERVLCSIFVNPAQFNDKGDLDRYPRTLEADREMLEKAGCDYLFHPETNEIYPPGFDFSMDFGLLATVMEGAYRPGHFDGVAKVVSRLFEIVDPDRAYFGEKDFQQLAIIREMNRRLKTGIQIIGCPTLRAEDGLALSSRNIHLTPEERTAAPVIYQNLKKAGMLIHQYGVEQARSMMIREIEAEGVFKVQYLEFADAVTLEPVLSLTPDRNVRVFASVITSKTRLIDNLEISH
jgi:pantoate--beta-alanine ligase